MSAAALHELRQALERRFPDALPLGRGLAPAVGTGIPALDLMLPGAGLARGRLTTWSPGGGATAALRTVVEAAARRGERSAWVDGACALSADFWRSGPLLVRPSTEREALVSTEELLRSGGFAVVVLTGAGPAAGREAVRLSRAARAGGAGFVLVTEESAVTHLRIASRIRPDGYRWRRDPFGEPIEVVAVEIEVEASSLGWSGRTSFELPVRTHHARSSPEPQLTDRRGAPRPKVRGFTVPWPRGGR
ncbi:MAG TPA: hypothetical protein VFZ24_14110 [Longimicrobiales bacterium]